MDKIRTGIIRCDLHTTYYLPLMQEHDPYALRDPKIGMGAYFYHYTYFNDPARLTVPKVWDFEVVKLWDADRARAEATAKILFDKPQICDTFEEVSEDVDLVFMPDCDGDGSDHLKLATPSIQKGIPTYIDKPLAFDVADARKIIDLAEKHNTPIFSRSILSEVPQAENFRSRFVELGTPNFGMVKGNAGFMAAYIHVISLAVNLFGRGAESVSAIDKGTSVYAHLDYGDRADRPKGGVMMNGVHVPTYHAAHYASAYSDQGAIHSPNIGDFEFPWGAARILEKVRDMVRTGKPPVAYDELVELIAIATAVRLSLKEHRRVRIDEV